MDRGSFINHIKTEDIYKDIANYVKKGFDRSNCEMDRLLPKGKNKKTDWMNEISIRWKDYDRVCRT